MERQRDDLAVQASLCEENRQLRKASRKLCEASRELRSTNKETLEQSAATLERCWARIAAVTSK
jgi:hypothetical protein